jgi:hypothetical protein
MTEKDAAKAAPAKTSRAKKVAVELPERPDNEALFQAALVAMEAAGAAEAKALLARQQGEEARRVVEAAAGAAGEWASGKLAERMAARGDSLDRAFAAEPEQSEDAWATLAARWLPALQSERSLSDGARSGEGDFGSVWAYFQALGEGREPFDHRASWRQRSGLDQLAGASPNALLWARVSRSLTPAQLEALPPIDEKIAKQLVEGLGNWQPRHGDSEDDWRQTGVAKSDKELSDEQWGKQMLAQLSGRIEAHLRDEAHWRRNTDEKAAKALETKIAALSKKPNELPIPRHGVFALTPELAKGLRQSLRWQKEAADQTGARVALWVAQLPSPEREQVVYMLNERATMDGRHGRTVWGASHFVFSRLASPEAVRFTGESVQDNGAANLRSQDWGMAVHEALRAKAAAMSSPALTAQEAVEAIGGALSLGDPWAHAFARAGVPLGREWFDAASWDALKKAGQGLRRIAEEGREAGIGAEMAILAAIGRYQTRFEDTEEERWQIDRAQSDAREKGESQAERPSAPRPRKHESPVQSAVRAANSAIELGWAESPDDIEALRAEIARRAGARSWSEALAVALGARPNGAWLDLGSVAVALAPLMPVTAAPWGERWVSAAGVAGASLAPAGSPAEWGIHNEEGLWPGAPEGARKKAKPAAPETEAQAPAAHETQWSKEIKKAARKKIKPSEINLEVLGLKLHQLERALAAGWEREKEQNGERHLIRRSRMLSGDNARLMEALAGALRFRQERAHEDSQGREEWASKVARRMPRDAAGAQPTVEELEARDLRALHADQKRLIEEIYSLGRGLAGERGKHAAANHDESSWIDLRDRRDAWVREGFAGHAWAMALGQKMQEEGSDAWTLGNKILAARGAARGEWGATSLAMAMRWAGQNPGAVRSAADSGAAGAMALRADFQDECRAVQPLTRPSDRLEQALKSIWKEAGLSDAGWRYLRRLPANGLVARHLVASSRLQEQLSKEKGSEPKRICWSDRERETERQEDELRSLANCLNCFAQANASTEGAESLMRLSAQGVGDSAIAVSDLMRTAPREGADALKSEMLRALCEWAAETEKKPRQERRAGEPAITRVNQLRAWGDWLSRKEGAWDELPRRFGAQTLERRTQAWHAELAILTASAKKSKNGPEILNALGETLRAGHARNAEEAISRAKDGRWAMAVERLSGDDLIAQAELARAAREKLKQLAAENEGADPTALAESLSEAERLALQAAVPAAKARALEGWEAVGLATEADLLKEGREHGHCVGSYASACINNHSRIFSLRNPNGKLMGTLEIAPARGGDNEWRQKQFLGKHNSQVTSPEARELADQVLAAYARATKANLGRRSESKAKMEAATEQALKEIRMLEENEQMLRRVEMRRQGLDPDAERGARHGRRNR